MYNPTYPFTKEVLDASAKAGSIYYVRNTYKRLFDHFDESIKGYYLITHYTDFGKAQAHFSIVGNDKAAFLYDWNNEDHKQRLYIAASQLEGYKIYSTYFLPNYKSLITKPMKDKINRYMYRHTDWKPGRGETVNLDFYMQYGSLYSTMAYRGQKIKVNFDDIEKL